MIRNLSEEERDHWDIEMDRYNKKQARALRPRFTERTIAWLIILVVLLTGAVGTCTTVFWQPTHVPVWDSTLENHSRIPDSIEQDSSGALINLGMGDTPRQFRPRSTTSPSVSHGQINSKERQRLRFTRDVLAYPDHKPSWIIIDSQFRADNPDLARYVDSFNNAAASKNKQ